jgi:hypothetical protein
MVGSANLAHDHDKTCRSRHLASNVRAWVMRYDFVKNSIGYLIAYFVRVPLSH